jgi:putative ABC transport system permease protein
MKALNRKLIRDIRTLRGPLVSIALVVAAGVMSAITMWSTFRSLEHARDTYFEDTRFADVFATLKRAPESVARELERVRGVMTVETRVVTDVVLSVPGLTRAATGHIVSVPENRRPLLNDLHLRVGRWVVPGRDDEVVVSERFAELNHLTVGDTISAVINGRRRTLDIVAIALSPEFIYEIAPAGNLVGDERLFGVLWMSRRALAAATNMEGAFNDVTFRLAPGASEASVIEKIDEILTPYGSLGAVGRTDQLSTRLVNDEIRQNRAIAIIVPVIFLSVATFLLHIVMMRLVTTQREQIGLLKAYGYFDRELVGHYLLLAIAAIGGGSAAGLVGGRLMGDAYTGLYAQYYRFPRLDFLMEPGISAGAILISALAAFAGAITAVRTVARLQPAVAMQAEAPATFRPLLLERWQLHRWLSSAQRMVMRNVERRPVRAVLSAAGVGSGLAVFMVGLVLFDSIDYMIDRQFRIVQREDLAVVFTNPVEMRAVRELQRIPGVTIAEPYRIVPVTLSSGHIERRTGITGLPENGRLRPMIDADGATHRLPATGLVLTRKLATVLGVEPGDRVTVELLDRGGEERRVAVSALMDELLGINGYMSMDALHEMLREEPAVSGVNLEIERGHDAAVFRELQSYPRIGSTNSKSAMLESFEATMADSVRITMTIVFILAAVLAVGVIYNGARITLSERGRELAGLRVLGFTRQEVAAMLLGEQAVITLAGLPLGVLLGYGVSVLVASAFDTELFRMPLVFRAKTVFLSAIVITITAALAGLVVRRRLDRADLIAVLKARE